jgi:hypothetical protein
VDITPADIAVLSSLGFDPAVGELLRGMTNKPFIPFGTGEGPPVAFTIDVADGEVAERFMKVVQPKLLPLGYRAFWTARHADDGTRIGHAVAVLHATDHYAILDVARPDGANYGLNPDDVRSRIKSWEPLCQFEVVGASGDWVAIVFQSLPAHLCAFVEDVYLFCADVFEPGMGPANRADAKARMPAARKLCPALSDRFWAAHDAKLGASFGEGSELAEFRDDLRRDTLRNVQLFAHKLAETKYLYLWWD